MYTNTIKNSMANNCIISEHPNMSIINLCVHVRMTHSFIISFYNLTYIYVEIITQLFLFTS